MVVGESGLGKSTLINSLFLTDIYCEVKMSRRFRLRTFVLHLDTKLFLGDLENSTFLLIFVKLNCLIGLITCTTVIDV